MEAHGGRRTSNSLASFGRQLYADGLARHHYLHAILGVTDKYRQLFGHLQLAWDVNAKWEALVPSANNNPCPMMLWRALVAPVASFGCEVVKNNRF